MFANNFSFLMIVFMKYHWNVLPCRDFCTGGPWWTDDTTVGSEDQHRPHSESSGCVRPGAVSCWKTSKKGRFIVMLNILQNILFSLINPAKDLNISCIHTHCLVIKQYSISCSCFQPYVCGTYSIH